MTAEVAVRPDRLERAVRRNRRAHRSCAQGTKSRAVVTRSGRTSTLGRAAAGPGELDGLEPVPRLLACCGKPTCCWPRRPADSRLAEGRLSPAWAGMGPDRPGRLRAPGRA